MPQIGGHLVIADRVQAALNHPPALQQHPDAYHLGAVGPDLFFFLFDPLGQSQILNVALDVYTVIHKIKEVIDETKDVVLEPAEDIANWFTGGMYKSLQGLVHLSYDALQNLVLMQMLPGSTETIPNPFAGLNYPGLPNQPDLVLQASDLSAIFRQFGHPYSWDTGYKTAEPPGVYNNWWWVDVLHYRRTSAFASHLVANAGANPLLQAYSTGYWTHVGGDVCGHPYVNGIVGGPYRTHVIRHMVVENVIDSWLWDHYQSADLINAELNKWVDVGGDIGGIIDHLLHSIDAVYVNPAAGPSIRPARYPNARPDGSDLERAYQTFLLFTELSTSAGLTPPEAPPGSPDQFFSEIKDELTKSVQSVGQSFQGIKWWQFWLWLFALFMAALRALQLIVKILTLPEAILVRLAMLAPRWAIYLIQCALYDYVMNARFCLALSGFGKVSSTDLARPFCQLCLVNPPLRSGLYQAFNYPYRQVPRNKQAFWLEDPSTTGAGLELQKFESNPYPQLAPPSAFVDGQPYDVLRDNSLRQFDLAYSPQITSNLEHDTIKGGQFGNAVEFSRRLITGAYPSTRFDLDADCGYAFRDWEGPPPAYVN